MHQKDPNHHIPVLLREVLEYLQPKIGETYLDLTAGYGGHAADVLNKTKNWSGAVLVDRDTQAINELTIKFSGKKTEIIHNDFYAAALQLTKQRRFFDVILADLGVSSPHLDTASRGFAIGQDGPLDMRMDSRQELTASEIVNTYSQADIARILSEYGEEPHARRIAHLLATHRPITTTTQLAAIAAKAWPRGSSRTHPATRTFQALRIAVNNELELLRLALPLWIDLLSPNGRIAVISFHSLEDRIVKQALSEQAGNRYDATLRLLTKHPVTPSQDESASNPRARSAKLRAAAKINI